MELDKEQPFLASWSHYLRLMRIKNTDERKFYKIESAKSGGVYIRTAENTVYGRYQVLTLSQK